MNKETRALIKKLLVLARTIWVNQESCRDDDARSVMAGIYSNLLWAIAGADDPRKPSLAIYEIAVSYALADIQLETALNYINREIAKGRMLLTPRRALAVR